MLNRAQIEAAGTRPAATMQVDELGGEVGLTLLTAQQLVDIRTWDTDDDIAVTCRFLSLVLCDEKGAPLYPEGDWPALRKLGWATLLRIAEKARNVNLLTLESREEMRKNSETAPKSEST